MRVNMEKVSRSYCAEDHISCSDEFHVDGELCQAWLKEIEGGKWTSEEKDLIVGLVAENYQIYFSGPLNTGQILRLKATLSRASSPRKPSRIKEISLEAFRIFKGKLKLK